MGRADSLEKILMLGKIEGNRRGWQKMTFLDGITNPKDMSLSKLWGLVMDREAWHTTVHGGQGVRQDWADKLNWTALILLSIYQCSYQKSNFKKNARWLLLLFSHFLLSRFLFKRALGIKSNIRHGKSQKPEYYEHLVSYPQNETQNIADEVEGCCLIERILLLSNFLPHVPTIAHSMFTFAMYPTLF